MHHQHVYVLDKWHDYMSISDVLEETIEVFRKKDNPADIWNKCRVILETSHEREVRFKETHELETHEAVAVFCSTAIASSFDKRVCFAIDLWRKGERGWIRLLKHQKTVKSFLNINYENKRRWKLLILM